MNAIELLRQEFKGAHEVLEGTMDDVTNEVLNFTDTNKALSVSSAYAHVVSSEDSILNGMILHKDPLAKDYQAAGMSIPMPMDMDWAKHNEWVKSVKLDLPKFREYAQKVYQQTDDYLASLKDEDLDQKIDSPMGEQTLAYMLANILLLHAAHLTGEISAAKGFQGKKGYPF
jgi:hypothetical protein